MPAVKNPVLKKARTKAANDRYAYVLKAYNAQRSVAEIADELGIHRATVYQILSKGKAK